MIPTTEWTFCKVLRVAKHEGITQGNATLYNKKEELRARVSTIREKKRDTDTRQYFLPCRAPSPLAPVVVLRRGEGLQPQSVDLRVDRRHPLRHVFVGLGDQEPRRLLVTSSRTSPAKQTK